MAAEPPKTRSPRRPRTKPAPAAGPATDWAAEAEAQVLDAARALAAELGWGPALVEAAARRAGLGPAEAGLLLPGGGRDLAALLSRSHDRAALAALAGVDPAGLKVRERIRRAVEARVEAAAADAAAVRRCTAYLALPPNLALGAALVWESADVLWRWAGDVATDENHYSKRAILSAILVNVVAVRLDQGREAAAEALERRIGQVMRFETWKANLPKPLAALQDVAGLLGRLRYR
jgi:ubiquinone biosynthesis protein COQ9